MKSIVFIRPCYHIFQYKNNTESKNPRVPNINKARIMILSKCEMFDSEKTIFIKEQEASGWLNQLILVLPLSKIPANI